MSSEIEALPPLREIIKLYGLQARKFLGQNFLLDLNLTTRIAAAAGPLDEFDIIEIGPGPGGLTRALLMAGARHVYAIERDQRCIDAAKPLVDAAEGRLTIVAADALQTDIGDLGNAPHKIVANLPYNIATPLLVSWLKKIKSIDRMTLMFQKEVASRLSANPGSKDYGRLSVITQWLCEVNHEFDISPKAFTPPPKVTSTVVTLAPRKQPLAPATFAKMEKATAAAFGQRRKMLRMSLKSLNLDFDDLGIDPTLRAENLSIEQFCRIAEAI